MILIISLLIILAVAAVAIWITTLICKLVLLTAAGAVFFSRFAFSALIGATLASGVPIIPDNGLVNFIIWTVLILGAFYLLSLMPRVDCALKFFCTAFVSYLVVEIVAMMLMSVLAPFTGSNFQVTIFSEIIIKIICIGISLYTLYKALVEKSFDTSDSVSVTVQRALAALICGLTFTFVIAISMNGVWSFAPWINWCIFGGGTALTYLADRFLLEKL